MSKRSKIIVDDTIPQKKTKCDTDFTKCILCCEETQVPLVERPKSYANLLVKLKVRSEYGNAYYSSVFGRLYKETEQTLTEKNATWHRSCYLKLTMKRDIKLEYDRLTKGTPRGGGDAEKIFTRSNCSPTNKSHCFFCQKEGTQRYKLHKLQTSNAGAHLRQAVDQCDNNELKVRLSEAIDRSDAHAIDVLYHAQCWAKYVTNTRRCLQFDHGENEEATLSAAQIEFFNLIESVLLGGNIVPIADIEKTYKNICKMNGATTASVCRKTLKKMLIEKFPDIEFSKPFKIIESERVSLKPTRDKALAEAEANWENNKDYQMSNLYSSAVSLRKVINSTKNWKFNGSVPDKKELMEIIPSELYCFMRWLISGPVHEVDSGCAKMNVIDNKAIILSQTVMFSCLSDRQARYDSGEIRNMRELPLQLALGINVHQTCRSRKMIDTLCDFYLSVDYTRVLQIENQIANQIIREINQNNGVFYPQNFVKGRHIFFAIDNCDFSEDTPDGKSTLHGTSIAVYQRKSENDTRVKFTLDPDLNKSTLDPLPNSMSELLHCNISAAPKPVTPVYNGIPQKDDDVYKKAKLRDMAWVVSMATSAGDDTVSSNIIPPWNAYNSLLSDSLPITSVSTPPLIAAPAHEWRTLLSVLKQAQDINALVVGPGLPTVVTLDMGLYQPAQQLVMSRSDLKNIILRPGELHIVMAMLRTIGTYISNSGLDACWIEASMYGSSTCKNILDAGHVKRAVEAHITTLLVLFGFYLDTLLSKDHEAKEAIKKCTTAIGLACETSSGLHDANDAMVDLLQEMDILGKMNHCNEDTRGNPMHEAMLQYMEMVFLMLQFIRAFHTADWNLHLESLRRFCKYFFALDKINYSRMIPLYLAQMHKVETEQPDLWHEFLSGNWVVNKNRIPFCAIGADHALEHVNRAMKVTGGIIGITLNDNARARFFLASPQLSEISKNAFQSILGQESEDDNGKHHQDNVSSRQRLHKNVKSLKDIMTKIGHPFEHQPDDIVNLLTKEVMAEGIKDDIMQLSKVGSDLLNTFIADRITSNGTQLWATMKKSKLKIWNDSKKKVQINDHGEKLVLKEDRSLFARLLIAARSRPEINIQEIICNYELSALPRTLFNPTGTLVHVSAKSQLMHVLENLVQNSETECTVTNVTDSTVSIRAECEETVSTGCHRVAVVDAMAEVQSMGKPHWIRSCYDLADHFLGVLQRKYNTSDKYEEVHVIFDRYDVEKSLKSDERKRRMRGQIPVAFHISDATDIRNVTMSKLLSHICTKNELSVYLAHHLLRYSSTDMKIVVSFQDKALSNSLSVEHLCSTQEEADTKIILHAVDATSRGATEICIFSPDTDVFILCVSRIPQLPKNTYFFTGYGNNFRKIDVFAVASCMTDITIRSLPGLHAISGADVTGSFQGKGKKSFWKAFVTCDDAIKAALICLGNSRIDEHVIRQIERLVCLVYSPTTIIEDVGKLRWQLFRQNQRESEKLPPTRAALEECIKRAHYQTLIWTSATVAKPEIPSPIGFGWIQDDNGLYAPYTTNLPPAPFAVLQLVRCNCKTTNCSNNRCRCKANMLNCTELCGCDGDEGECNNVLLHDTVGDSDVNEEISI